MSDSSEWLWQFDHHIAVLDTGGVHGHRLRGRECRRDSGLEIEFGTVAGALDLVVEHLAFGKRCFGVATPIAHAYTSSSMRNTATRWSRRLRCARPVPREIVERSDANGRHSRPSSWASMNLLLILRRRGPATSGSGNRSSASWKNPRHLESIGSFGRQAPTREVVALLCVEGPTLGPVTARTSFARISRLGTDCAAAPSEG